MNRNQIKNADTCSDVNKDLGLKAKAKAKDSDPKAKAKDLSHKGKAKAKELDFGLKDQGQGLTSLDTWLYRTQHSFLKSLIIIYYCAV